MPLAQALILALLAATHGGSPEHEPRAEQLTAADVVWSYDTGG